jgi:hypothetical protein
MYEELFVSVQNLKPEMCGVCVFCAFSFYFFLQLLFLSFGLVQGPRIPDEPVRKASQRSIKVADRYSRLSFVRPNAMNQPNDFFPRSVINKGTS